MKGNFILVTVKQKLYVSYDATDIHHETKGSKWPIVLRWQSTPVMGTILILKPRADVTRISGYSYPIERLMSSNIKKGKKDLWNVDVHLPISRTIVSTTAMAAKYKDNDLFLFCFWTIT